MFFVLSFFFYKIEEQESTTSPAQGGRVGISGRGEVAGKGGRRVNIVHVKNCQIKTMPRVEKKDLLGTRPQGSHSFRFRVQQLG
jgi:hypothetical protein